MIFFHMLENSLLLDCSEYTDYQDPIGFKNSILLVNG